jgi:AcrR family transcriptional regulator
MSQSSERQGERREHLVEAALRLFARDGYRATGIERILAEAQVAKMTLYRHFRSKDELIQAALQKRDNEILEWLFEVLAKAGPDPRTRLLSLFDAYEAWFLGEAGPEGRFNGCSFINAAAEHLTVEEPLRGAVLRHKRRVRARLQREAERLGAAEPAALATQLMLLLEGAIVTFLVSQDPETIRQARAAAVKLIEAEAAAEPLQ